MLSMLFMLFMLLLLLLMMFFLVFRPPVYGSNGRTYKMLVMFSFFLGCPERSVPDGLLLYRRCFFFFRHPNL